MGCRKPFVFFKIIFTIMNNVLMRHAIPQFDYLRQLAGIKADVLREIEATLDSGQLILGSRVEALESGVAASCGVRYGIGVNSGTDAIVLALSALDIGAGDEVITVANTAVPTVAAIRLTGAIPKFVDIDRATLLMSADGVGDAITSRTRAIVAVHLHGRMCDLAPICAIAKRHDIRLVEDCAQSFGATYHDRRAGSIGDVGCFSFYPTKNLGAFGDGGMCVTDDEYLAGRMRRLRSYGYSRPQYSREEGFNTRLDELQAGILLVKLKFIELWNRQRQEIAAQYRGRLADCSPDLLTCPLECGDDTHVYHQFVVRTRDRDRLRKRLESMGVGCGVHYPFPIHQMQAYQFLGYGVGSLPETESACKQILSLPIFPELRPDEVDTVADAICCCL
jgi:dTDP-3-amino-2,3,6-trideoxy-4-keto-D-glucose/dTDP-3-amino-3,4,6-trideoxy-alpha-D-glucose/dTDP-2,6-dideoxy-D-kanosamine transaminase